MNHEVEKTKRNTKFVRYLLIILFPLLLPYILWTILFNIHALLFRGAPFIPTQQERIKRMIELANVKPGERAADIGSGDGRLVFALAKAGAEAHGYEIHPWLVWLSKRVIRKTRLTGKAFIHRKNYWHEDFSKFDIVTVYATPRLMKRLEVKLKRELKTDARVISNIYTFPTWLPSKEEDNVYLYEQNV